MSNALRAEFLKLRTTRSTGALIGLAAALTALIATIEGVTAGTGRVMAIPSLSTPAGLRDALTSTGFALLMAAVLGVTSASGEFRLKTATDTYLDEPDRTKVLAAKAIAATCAGLLLGLAAAATATGITLGFAAANGGPLALPAGTILRFAAGATIGSGLLAAAGVAAGSLIRHQVSAIIAVFTWGFVIELIISGTESAAGAFLPYTAAATLAGVASGTGMPQVPRGVDPLPFAAATGLLIGIALLLSAAAAFTTVRRDIS
jgi:ABC-type transport system involved in multi-copper enzyme maturation permease subunit